MQACIVSLPPLDGNFLFVTEEMVQKFSGQLTETKELETETNE